MELADLKDKTAIVGVGYTPQGTLPGRSTMSVMVEASKNAIEDAGLRKEDIDGLILQPPSSVPISAWAVAPYLGLNTLRFISDQSAIGASAGCQAQHAAMAVTFGLANYVLCLFGENARTGPPPAYLGRPQGEPVSYGMFGAAMTYALAARRGMHEFRTGPETWCEIAVNQRRWANLNPRATMYKRTMNREDYFNEPWVAEPFRRADCCLLSDGGRAFIVTTTERARDLKQPPVYISGMGQCHLTPDVVRSKTSAGPTGAKESGAEAFKMAGITLADIDACEIYDCFTYTVEISLQSYGFFKPGEGKDFFKDNRTGPGGEFPVNTSGGLLSEVYFMGFTPLTEGVMQLRGQCGERQLKNPHFILCSGNGGTLQTHSTTILRR